MADDRLTELLLRWEEAWEHGQDVPVQELCKDCPELVGPLQEKIDALKQMEWMNDDEARDEDRSGGEEFIGKTLASRYRIEGLLGEGGFGLVFRAFDPELQRPVAIKIPRWKVKVDGDRPDNLLEEARKLAKLRCPGIVAVHDAGQENGVTFIVSDFIDGQNLADFLAKSRPSPRDAARLVAEIAENLHLAHEQGFVHRDIKPANILIDRQGRPLLTDFGIAISVKDEPPDDRPFGTLPYMAPEAIEGHGRPSDRQTDIYALGVVFYELLTGRLPFVADNTAELTRQILSGDLPHPKTLLPEIPEELQSICLKCLARNPATRYQRAGELAQALRSMLGRRPLSIRTLAIVLLGVGVVLAAVVAISAMLRTRPQENTPPSSTAVPFLANVNLVQFHPLQREIYVLDPHVTEIRYSLDGTHWKTAKSFRIQGLAMQWATAAITSEDVQHLAEAAKSGHAKLWVRYTNDSGVKSVVSELTLDASKFQLPIEIPKVELPKGLPGVGGVTQP